MKVNQIVETTTSGSVASVAAPLSTQKRGGNLLTGKTTKKKYANSLGEDDTQEKLFKYSFDVEYLSSTTGLKQLVTQLGGKVVSIKKDRIFTNSKHVTVICPSKAFTKIKNKLWELNGGLSIEVTKLGPTSLSESKMKQLAVDIRDLDNGNFMKRYGKSKEQMQFSLGDPSKVLQTNESKEENFVEEKDSILYDVMETMKLIAARYKQYSSDKTSSVPSAPDTSKFYATKSNMIRVVKDAHTGGGTYSPSKTFPYFLQIGSGIDYKIRDNMKEEFLKEFFDAFGMTPAKTFMSGDGYRFIFSEVDGSNWGGFGFLVEHRPGLVAKQDTVNEEKLEEEDKIFAPGKGSKRKTGLHKPGEEKKLSHFKHPFKSSGIHISDSRGNKVCEAENEDVAKEVCKAINEYVKMDESMSSEPHISMSMAKSAWKGIKDFTQIPEKVSGHEEDLDNYFGIGKMNETYKNPNTDYFDDIPRNKWKEEVLRRFPDARFLVAPEEQGGTVDAWNNKDHVGDWDGYDNRGTVKKISISENTVHKSNRRNK